MFESLRAPVQFKSLSNRLVDPREFKTLQRLETPRNLQKSDNLLSFLYETKFPLLVDRMVITAPLDDLLVRFDRKVSGMFM